MVVRLMVLIVCLLVSTVASAKGLSARVDRNQLGMGEQLELTVTLTDVRGQRPDTRGLLKDFSIDRQSQKSNVQIINGVVNQEASWVFLLSPNRKGKLTIPALTVDRFSSDPITITVTDMPVAQSTSDDVLMEIEVSPANPYVQSQVAYIQRLYFSRPLVDSASISRPKLSKGDADIQFWGSSEPRYVTHKNRPYQLIERYYIIYPRKPGVLEFEPSVFNGSLASSRRRNDFQMNMYRTGTRVNAYSDKASIIIKDKPVSLTSENWLPATQLTLNVNFSQSPETLKAGEPLTLTLALMAEGLKAEVLPEIKLDLPNTVKSYPEKPTFRTDKVRNGMVGLRQEKVVLIANEAGEYVIPEVKIPWWNVTEDKLEFATLESVVLKVADSVMSQSAKSDSEPLAGADMQKEDSEGLSETKEEAEKEQEKDAPKPEALLNNYSSGLEIFYNKYKNELILGLTSIIGLMLLSLLFWRRRNAHLNSSEYQQKLASDHAIKSLESACQRNDLQLTIETLPAWAEVVGIYPSTIAGIEKAGDPQLRAPIIELTAAKYAQSTAPWSGRALQKATRDYSKANQSKVLELSELKPLHPVSS